MALSSSTPMLGRSLRARLTAYAGAAALVMASVVTFASPAFAGTLSPIVESADPVPANTSYTYSITAVPNVSNNVLEMRLSGVAASFTGYTVSDSSVSCFINSPTFMFCPQLPESGVTVTVTVLPTEAGTVTFDARLIDTGTVTASESTTITAAGTDLGVTVSDSADPAALGDTFTYTATPLTTGQRPRRASPQPSRFPGRPAA